MTRADPDPTRKGLFLKLPKAVSAVEEGRRAVLDYLQPLQLDSRIVNRLEVVLEELVSNVVRHSDEATHLKLSASTCDDGVCLCVEDNGEAFNPLDSDAPAPFDTLGDAQLGGLGIPLVKRLSHSLEYQRIGSANRISAVIALSGN